MHVAESESDLHGAAAAAVVAILGQAIAQRRRARWVLAGGSTPLGLYRALASRHRRALDWSRVEFFWGDERAVPRDHPESNYGAALRSLLAPLAIARLRMFPIRGGAGAAAAARDYDAVVARALAADDDAWDLVLLGLGTDGHTASLFPAAEAKARAPSWAVDTLAPEPPRQRVSLTLRALNRSREVLFLAAGEAKAPAVAGVLAGDPALPASWVRPAAGAVSWYLDTAAAGPAAARAASRIQSPSAPAE